VPITTTPAELLRQSRLDRALSQRELARLVEISAARISAYELGKRQPTLAALNEVLVVEAAGARVSDESLANWATAFWEQYLLERRVSDYRERMARRPVIDPA